MLDLKNKNQNLNFQLNKRKWFGHHIPGVTKHFSRGLEYGSARNRNIKLFLECAKFNSRSIQKKMQVHIYFQSVFRIYFVIAGRCVNHIFFGIFYEQIKFGFSSTSYVLRSDFRIMLNN